MKIVISGYGKMGHMVEEVLKQRGLECAGTSEDITSFDRTLASESVCIDFTRPEAFCANYRFLAENFKAVVVGTTGWNDIRDDVLAYFRKCGTTMIFASNFSIGVNVTFALASLAAEKLKSAGYHASVVETHHIHKLDAPSGTAVSLAGIVGGITGQDVPIESRRIGEVPGVHNLVFKGSCDLISIKHEAFSRRGFAEGAVTAALMTEDVNGVFEFKDLILK